MAWDANNKWVYEDPSKLQVTQQASQLTGLLDQPTNIQTLTGGQTGTNNSTSPSPTGVQGLPTPVITPTPAGSTPTPTPTTTPAPTSSGVITMTPGMTMPSNLSDRQQYVWRQLEGMMNGEKPKNILQGILWNVFNQGGIPWLKRGETTAPGTSPTPNVTPTTPPATTPPPGTTPPPATTPPPSTTPPPATTPPPSTTNPGDGNGPTTPTTPPPAPFTTPGTGGALTTTAVSGEAPTPQNASVSEILTGMLDDNNPYMKAAREAGLRTANRRGLLNTSIAAGASEASAIAAAAPLASQEAAQIHQRNQTAFEGWNQLRNSSAIQNMSDTAAMERQKSQEASAKLLQMMGDASAMERLIKQGDIEKILQEMRNDNALTQTQINANVSLITGYMNAFATLSTNPELPSSARNSYMREFIRTTGMGQNLVNALAGTTVTWPSS